MTAPAAVDQLTDRVMDTIDTYRYRPQRIAMHLQILLRSYCNNTPLHSAIQVKLVQPVLELWDRADTYCGNPVGEWGSAYAPCEYAGAWGARQAHELRWDAREHVRIYLTELLDGEQ